MLCACRYFALTMVISIAWLGIIVDIMVGAFEQIGETVNMSEATMGLVFSAIGTSFPDFLASLIVAKKGMADMAVSNAFGSNIFDMLLGLAFPWCLMVRAPNPPANPLGGSALSGLPRLRRSVVQMAVYDPGATLYVGDPADDGLGSLKASLELLLVTLAAW